jgi:hypothetical protein
MCPPLNGTTLDSAKLVCDLGNIASHGDRLISVLARVAQSAPASDSVFFSASAETNNETGPNRQIVTDSSDVALHLLAFNADKLTTFNVGGVVSTSALSAGGGNLQTTLNLIQNNGGNGNSIAITESFSTTQPTYCVNLKLTCQLDSAEVTVNGGATVHPYLETVLTANVPKTYNIKKAFVIHVTKVDGVDTVETGFPIYNVPASSCNVSPPSIAPIPCATFSLAGTVLTVTIHTSGNGHYNF